MRYPIKVKEMSMLILDELFHLDRASQALVATENPDYKIPLSELEEAGGYYKAELHAKTIEVRLPLRLTDESFWRDAAAMESFNKDSRIDQNPVHLVDPQLAMRLSGKLPVIDICGDEFTVDLHLGELRHLHSDPMTNETKINLKELEPDFENDRYLFLYNPQKKCEYLLDFDAISIPEHVKAVSVPSEYELDPVGYAIHSGMGPSALLGKYPNCPKLEALVVPMEKTNIPDSLRANRERSPDSILVRTEKLKETAKQEKKQVRGRRKRPLL